MIYVMLLGTDLRIQWHSRPGMDDVYGHFLWDFYPKTEHRRASQQAVAAAIQFGESHAAIVDTEIPNRPAFTAVIRAFRVGKNETSVMIMAAKLPDNVRTLTDRELEVVQLSALHLDTQAISERLGISEATVNTHRARARQKLGIEVTSELVQFAILMRLTTDELYNDPRKLT